MRRLSDLDTVISQSFGPQGDSSVPRNRAKGVVRNTSSALFKAAITCTVRVVFSQVASHSDTHIVGLFWRVPPDHTDDSAVRRVPFKLMLSGRA